MFAHSDLNSFFTSVDINPFSFSDHSEVSFHFSVNHDSNCKDNPAGNWIFNASLLNDPGYAAKVHDFWHS